MTTVEPVSAAALLDALNASARSGGSAARDALHAALTSPDVALREPALRVGAAAFSDDTLVEFLRDGADDILRNAGLEMLVQRGATAVPVLIDLLEDRDPDVVLQSVLALDRIRDHRAVEPLGRALEHPNPNVVQAALTALGHLGHRAAVPLLTRFVQADLWLKLAAIEALGDLRAAEAIPALVQQLEDPMVGSVATEALARIGGPAAFDALARAWLGITGTGEPQLTQLVHVIEGLDDVPTVPQGLLDALVVTLQHNDGAVQIAASRGLLALGATAAVEHAIAVLERGSEAIDALPTCLRRRRDLVSTLLAQSGVAHRWGLRLVARHPYAVSVRAVEDAIARTSAPGDFPDLMDALLALEEPRLTPAVVQLYGRVGREGRRAMIPVINWYRPLLREALAASPSVAPDARVVLEAVAAEPAVAARALVGMENATRLAALDHFTDRPDVLTLLPWREWLATDPVRYAPLAAQIADHAGVRMALADLGDLLAGDPHPDIIRLAARIRDPGAVPALEALVGRRDAVRGPWAMAALGAIGGDRARDTLRQVARSGDDWARHAFRALAECRSEDDLELFRDGLSADDWHVRMTCVTVIGIARRPEDRAALALAATDSVRAVADRARGYLVR